MNKCAKIEGIIASDFSHSWQCSNGASHLSGMLWARFFQFELYEQKCNPPWGAHTSLENSDRKPNYQKKKKKVLDLETFEMCQDSTEEGRSRVAWDHQGHFMDQATLDLGFEEWTWVNWVKATAPQIKVRESHAKEQVSLNKQCLFKERWAAYLKDRHLRELRKAAAISEE